MLVPPLSCSVRRNSSPRFLEFLHPALGWCGARSGHKGTGGRPGGGGQKGDTPALWASKLIAVSTYNPTAIREPDVGIHERTPKPVIPKIIKYSDIVVIVR